jgi:hypothetical protein
MWVFSVVEAKRGIGPSAGLKAGPWLGFIKYITPIKKICRYRNESGRMAKSVPKRGMCPSMWPLVEAWGL